MRWAARCYRLWGLGCCFVDGAGRDGQDRGMRYAVVLVVVLVSGCAPRTATRSPESVVSSERIAAPETSCREVVVPAPECPYRTEDFSPLPPYGTPERERYLSPELARAFRCGQWRDEHRPAIKTVCEGAASAPEESGSDQAEPTAEVSATAVPDPCAEHCRKFGLCGERDGRCMAYGDAACSRSEACKTQGKCVVVIVNDWPVCGKRVATQQIPTHRPTPNYKPAPTYQPPAYRPTGCVKGCPCGNSCISCKKRCRK
jgi:hypothetical protein